MRIRTFQLSVVGLLLITTCAAHAGDAVRRLGAASGAGTMSAGAISSGNRSLVRSEPALEQTGATVMNASCGITASALISAGQQTVLVDVRPAAMYAQTWIPGSANLGPGLLDSNLLVKSAPSVVLVGSGKDTPDLLRRCQLLRGKGLSKVRVLEGGLPAWYQAGGNVAGNTAMLDKPLLLDDAELHAWLSHGGAVVVLANANAKAPRSLAASKTFVIRASTPAQSANALLDRIPNAQSRSTSAVVFLPTSQDVPKWRALARSKGLPDPVFFVGAPSRYDHYLKQLASVATAASAPSSMCRPN